MTIKQKIVSQVIVGSLFRISELIAMTIKPIGKLSKSRKLHYLYIYFKYEQDFLYPLAEKICYCLGLRKEWNLYQEELARLEELIFGSSYEKE